MSLAGSRRSGGGSMLEELPSELLRCIAGHMSNVEWARVRGTCQSFSQVQLRSINIFLPNVASLRWCTRLWQEAESIALSLNQLDLASSQLSQVLEEGARCVSPEKLTELCMGGLHHDRMEDESLPWLNIILTRAANLQALVLNGPRGGRICSLSVGSQLRHLAIHVSNGMSEQACLSIEALKSLETISITSPPSYLPTHTPSLDLRGCRNLRAAYFSHAVPEILVGVPDGCRLMVECDFEVAMPRWTSCSQMCTGIRVNDLHLPRAIFNLPCPMLTQMELTSIGHIGLFTASIVIGNSVPNLRVLKVHCFDVALRIEASVQLRHLSIHVEMLDELFISDISKMTMDMTNLRLSIKTNSNGSTLLVARDSVLSQLKAALVAKSAQVRSKESARWLDVEYFCDTRSKQDLYSRCRCLIDGGGACIDCLMVAGVIRPGI